MPNEPQPAGNEEIERLLEAFETLTEGREPRKPTLLEISGYPHYENVSSNILAFFLDPANPHGLGTAVLDALFAAAKLENPGYYEEVEITREQATARRNRIDILIDTGKYLLALENKIYAGCKNPFVDYLNYLEKNANGKKTGGILLTIGKQRHHSGFTNITYETLFAEIKNTIGNVLQDAQQPYLAFLLDFMTTMDNLGGSAAMPPDMDFVTLLSEHWDALKRYESKCRELRPYLMERATTLKNLTDSDLPAGFESWGRIYQGHEGCIASYVCEHRGPGTLAADMTLCAKGWYMDVFMRTGRRNLAPFFTSLGNTTRREDVPGTNKTRIWTGLDFGADIEKVKKETLRLLNLLHQHACQPPAPAGNAPVNN